MWAVDSLGWNGLSAPRIVDRTLRLTTPGAILIFHVGAQSQDAAALPSIIQGLREQGYEFVSLAHDAETLQAAADVLVDATRVAKP